MIHKTDFFNQIDDYCLEQLEREVKHEFEVELTRNTDLRKELELRKEIQSAIQEKDILDLRKKLENIAEDAKPGSSHNGAFDFLNDFSDLHDLTEILSPQELINFYDSLPKAHVYQHELSASENILQFYKEQNLSEFGEDVESLAEEDLDFTEFEGLEEAVMEKDILALRQTLKQVAKAVEPQFSIEDIDQFLNDELNGSQRFDFEKELGTNFMLQNEVKLHSELEEAMRETDVSSLRGKLNSIVKTETSWNVSEENIEAFIDGELGGEDLEFFRSEFHENTDLQAEVKLRQQINDFMGESDVTDLKRELIIAQQKADVKIVNMFIPETKTERMKFWRNSVAVIVVLLSIAGVLRNGMVSVDTIYDNYYESPAWAAERSFSSELNFLQMANAAYLGGDYQGALTILAQAPESEQLNPVTQFFSAASWQKMGEFESAALAYSKVIEHGNNIFIEEAEWYRSLCNLKVGNKNTAKQQLLAVVERKGHYGNDAKAVLRRLKYKLE